jgi:hypothetical protein
MIIKKEAVCGRNRKKLPVTQEMVTKGLDNARWQSENVAIWEEEDYCVPPLAQERAAVLDEYFTELEVQHVNRDEGWKQIESLKKVWNDK